ncbi:uncharacterized protein LOC127856080 [Dreissena polymorpha]|uniref:Uncharacterized protein n=1 Tax=Dreissena polymorpha TaxID=45954 RepID=A0A9D4C0N3_DREPO|nr:uncharacterized protein LOC127856080 [Dreissena polymorpha]KAH3715000.1 hypothetical protein DPMN_057703 [Dreissena polymorpha]
MFKLFVLCLVPCVLCAPQKKFIEQFGLPLGNLFDLNTLKCDVQIMLDVLGADPTEQACEAECHKLVQDGTTLSYGCPLVCHAFQNLAHYFHETPKPGQANTTCGGLNVNPGK